MVLGVPVVKRIHIARDFQAIPAGLGEDGRREKQQDVREKRRRTNHSYCSASVASYRIRRGLVVGVRKKGRKFDGVADGGRQGVFMHHKRALIVMGAGEWGCPA